MFCKKPQDLMWRLPFFENCVKAECDGHCRDCVGMANIGGHWTVVVVGHPALTAEDLDCPSVNHRTSTRFLPRILVELGFFPSNSQAIRQCAEWKVSWADDVSAFEMIRLAKNGKRKNEFVALIIGPASQVAREE